MGSGRFDSRSYASYSASTSSKSTEQIYSSRHMDNILSPFKIKTRESRDSSDNPNATPVIVALDVTGSMGMLADVIARSGLGVLFQSILDRKPIPDPHIMFMGIGDAACDSAPLQCSQFEASNVIIDQLAKLWLEHGGGGNDSESYNLPWYFAAFHTSHDAFEKRGRKGYLFTVGDECSPHDLTNYMIEKVCGDTLEQPLSTEVMLQLAQRCYNVYHINIMEGSYASSHPDQVRQSWAKLLGQNVIHLKDHKKLAETIVSIIEVAEGADAKKATSGWDAATARIVHDAVKHLPSPARPQLGAPGA